MKSSFSLSSFFVVLFFLALVVVPVVRYSGSAEPASWAIARARHLHKAGEQDKALRLMRDALVLAEGIPSLEMEIARWLYQNGHAVEGLELIERLIASNVDDDLVAFGLDEKSNCLSYLGRYREALLVASEMYELDPDKTWNRNDLAYHRGLAGIELEEALKDIRRVLIESGHQETFQFGDTNMPYLEKTMVAICVSSLSVDRQLPILARLNPLINSKREDVLVFQEDFFAYVYEKFTTVFPLTGVQERGVKQRINGSETTKRSLAFLLICRALVYQHSGDEARCDQDRREVLHLGFDPDRLVDELPSDLNCLGFLLGARAWLDTRGVIYAGMKSSEQAKRDYDFSIMASDVISEFYQRNSYFNETVDVRQVKRSLATLIYHRMQLSQSLGDSESTKLDRRRIEALGFEPGNGLF